MEASVIAALVGCATAVLGIVIRDLWIAKSQAKASAKKALTNRKLENIYSPLMSVMGTRDSGNHRPILNIVDQQDMREKIQSNLHLLSDNLREIAIEAMQMGKGPVGNLQFTTKEMERGLALSRSFRDQLIKEYAELTKEA